MRVRKIGWEPDSSGSGSCPIAGIGWPITDVEPSGCATRDRIS
jgi:hypothetical protein